MNDIYQNTSSQFEEKYAIVRYSTDMGIIVTS